MTISLPSPGSSRFSLRRRKALCHARFLIFALLVCLLSITHGQGLRCQETPLDLDFPEVVFLGEDSSRFWEAWETPLPSLIAKGAKEEPQVDLKVVERIDKGEKAARAAKRPGCAYSGAVTTSVARVAQGAEADYQQGVKRYLSEDFEGALESLSRVVESYPESQLTGYSYYFMGESFYHLGRNNEALTHFQQVVERYPNHQLLDWAHYSIGWICLEKEDFQNALSHFQAITRRHEESDLVATALFWESEALGRSGQTEQAIALKSRFLEMYPTHSRAPDVQLSMGGYLFRLHRFREAAEAFREFTVTYPSHRLTEQALYSLGQSLIYEGRYDEGISVLKSDLQRFPNTPLAGFILLGLVRGYLGNNEGDIALETCKELLGRFPHFEWTDRAFFDVGYSYLMAGEYARSVEIYQDFLKIRPGSNLKALVYLNLGEALYNLKRYGEAIDSYRLAQEVVRDDSILQEVLFKVGLSLYQQREYRRAIESWMRLREDFPDSMRRDEATYWMGEAFLQNRNPKRAMALFKDIEENPEIHPRVLDSLGRYYSQEGQWSLAIHQFLKLLDGYPNHALSAGAYLRLGEAFYNRRDYSKALSYLNELAQQGEAQNLDRVYFIQGRIYYKEGKFDLALDRFLHVVEAFSESPMAEESQYWIAWSFYRMGMHEKAIGEFTKVIDNPPSSTHAAQALLRIGDCHYDLGFYLEASLAYLEVIREFPQSREVPEAEYGILLVYERQGKYESFMERASAFFSRYPTHPLGADIMSRIAQHHLDDNQVERAILTYRELLRKYSRSDLADDAQFKLGEIYRDQQDFKSAVVEFGLVVKQYPRSSYLVEAYFEIAESYFALGNYRRALEGYERVAGGFSESHLAGKAYLRSADCFGRLDRIDFAEERLTELMERVPKDPIRVQAAMRLGLILFETMRYGEAIKVLREVTNTGDPEVASLAQLKIGEVYREIGDRSTAVVEFMKAIYLYPGQMSQVDAALFEVGEIYMEQKKWANAREIYSKVIETSGSESAREKARNILAEIDRRTENE